MVARDPVDPIAVSGRRQRRDKITRRTLNRAFLLGSLAVAGLLAYTVPHALAAKEGYEQNKIRHQIQEIARENEVLQAELMSLKNPQVIEAYAQQQGMALRDKARFVTLKMPKKAAAPPPKPTLMSRMASFGFR